MYYYLENEYLKLSVKERGREHTILRLKQCAEELKEILSKINDK